MTDERYGSKNASEVDGDLIVSQEPQPGSSRKKVDAIYSLREAAEAKTLAEVKVAIESTPAARDELLDAQINLESKTQDAIEACHECGHQHAQTEPHYTNNLLTPDFKKRQETDDTRS